MTIPQTMRAAILVEQRKPLVISDIEMPRSLEPGQVLVKVHCSGICGSQLGEIDGVKGEDRFLPHLLGHEGSGQVVEAGLGVRHVKAGDHVVMHWRKGLGIESVGPKFRWDGKVVNAGWVTSFNEYAIVSENRLTAIPADSDLEVAALFGCAVTTGFGVVVNDAKLTIGESVVIFGAGGVGLNIVQAAALVSGYPVIAVDLYDEKLKLAKSLGATHTINARSQDAKQAIRELLGPAGCDVFIDNTGNPEIIRFGYDTAKPQGRVVLVGVPRKGNETTIYTLPLHFGKTLRGSQGGEAQPHTDIPRYHDLYRKGRLELKSLVTQHFKLDDINEAIAAMRDGRVAGRCLVMM
jgi:S-(hydroxymethyl)glutathione dehydrogenase/alcohol dehydrogenase